MSKSLADRPTQATASKSRSESAKTMTEHFVSMQRPEAADYILHGKRPAGNVRVTEGLERLAKTTTEANESLVHGTSHTNQRELPISPKYVDHRDRQTNVSALHRLNQTNTVASDGLIHGVDPTARPSLEVHSRIDHRDRQTNVSALHRLNQVNTVASDGLIHGVDHAARPPVENHSRIDHRDRQTNVSALYRLNQTNTAASDALIHGVDLTANTRPPIESHSRIDHRNRKTSVPALHRLHEIGTAVTPAGPRSDRKGTKSAATQDTTATINSARGADPSKNPRSKAMDRLYNTETAASKGLKGQK
eukprot:c14596_g1_i2.p1 GENE.c14596_g1_i2~~c14596_g1_i2.p1  ORF type:complete len:306 (+),score=52.51 c14596_g1_i2:16-933(+)